MNEQLIQEAMAVADGWIPNNDGYDLWIKTDPSGYKYQSHVDEFDYLTDANQIDRMVRGLDDAEMRKYITHLARILCCFIDGYPMHRAAEDQKVEAYLKVLRKWTKEME